MQKSCRYLLHRPSYSQFCPKFRCHGNGGRQGRNLNDTIARGENSVVDANSVQLSFKGAELLGKEWYKKSRKRYISPIRGEASRQWIFSKFCISGDMPDVIIFILRG